MDNGLGDRSRTMGETKIVRNLLIPSRQKTPARLHDDVLAQNASFTSPTVTTNESRRGGCDRVYFSASSSKGGAAERSNAPHRNFAFADQSALRKLESVVPTIGA